MSEDYTFLRNDQLKIMRNDLEIQKAHIDFFKDTINRLEYELGLYKKALELMAKDLNSLAPVCKVSFDYCPRTNGTDINHKCDECWQKDYINKAKEVLQKAKEDYDQNNR